jgi:hypothetical protein
VAPGVGVELGIRGGREVDPGAFADHQEIEKEVGALLAQALPEVLCQRRLERRVVLPLGELEDPGALQRDRQHQVLEAFLGAKANELK